MKKPGPILIALVILGALTLILMAATGILWQLSAYMPLSGANIGHGITEKQKADALEIAEAEPCVRDALNDSGSSGHALEISSVDPSELGFINVTGPFIRVKTVAKSGDIPVYTVYVAVDPRKNKEMYMLYDSDLFVNPYRVIIPPNASFDYVFRDHTVRYGDGSYGRELCLAIGLDPLNATLCPLILDEDNMNKFRHHEPYSASTLIDRANNTTVTVDGSHPAGDNWTVSLAVTPPQPAPKDGHYHFGQNDTKYYHLVLKNNGDHDVKVDLSRWML